MLVALVMILGVVGVALLLRPWPFFLPREQIRTAITTATSRWNSSSGWSGRRWRAD